MTTSIPSVKYPEVCTATHHVYDLLEGEPEGEDHGVGLVDDRALQLVVVGQQIVQQPPLMQTTLSTYTTKLELIQRILSIQFLEPFSSG